MIQLNCFYSLEWWEDQKRIFPYQKWNLHLKIIKVLKICAQLTKFGLEEKGKVTECEKMVNVLLVTNYFNSSGSKIGEIYFFICCRCQEYYLAKFVLAVLNLVWFCSFLLIWLLCWVGRVANPVLPSLFNAIWGTLKIMCLNQWNFRFKIIFNS